MDGGSGEPTLSRGLLDAKVYTQAKGIGRQRGNRGEGVGGSPTSNGVWGEQ